MSKMIERVAKAIQLRARENQIALISNGSAGDLARAAIEAMRSFNTEDFTLTEAAGIRRLIDAALATEPAS